MSAQPRFSERAVVYLEDFDRRAADDRPLSLRTSPAVCHGHGDDAIAYDGPHLIICGYRGTCGTATINDPVKVTVGETSFLMRREDFDRIKSAGIDLLLVLAPSRQRAMHFLTIT